VNSVFVEARFKREHESKIHLPSSSNHSQIFLPLCFASCATFRMQDVSSLAALLLAQAANDGSKFHFRVRRLHADFDRAAQQAARSTDKEASATRAPVIARLSFSTWHRVAAPKVDLYEIAGMTSSQAGPSPFIPFAS
jgi:hypothetical protein